MFRKRQMFKVSKFEHAKAIKFHALITFVLSIMKSKKKNTLKKKIFDSFKNLRLVLACSGAAPPPPIDG